ncbi:hypothetical protein C8T65DRAFT_737871 [Cerioporus squamosus]|nr:hypothetical protein C8T65DRAFT_737871 [Cerioporus squamosus]
MPHLMAGDFNNIEDNLDRLPVGDGPDQSIVALDELKSGLGLMLADGWRVTYPHLRKYTFHRGSGRNAVFSRLDRIYVTPTVFNVSVQLTADNAPVMGPGRPLFLLQLLKDKNLVHSSETYQQPRLRNYVTRGPDPVLLRRFEARPSVPRDREDDIGLIRLTESPTPYTPSRSPDIVSDHELHSTVESHLASEDIAEMVLGAGLTDTLEWDDEPARAETALGTVSEGTSATLCKIPLSKSEDTLGSGISELEVIELRWNGDVIYGGVVYADDEDSVADNLSDLVFATNAIEPTVAGPRYDVNGYLIEDEEDMIIGSLLDD